MDAGKLIELTKAEIVLNRAAAWVDGKRIFIARNVDGAMQLTQEGRDLVQKLEEAKKKAAPSKAVAEPKKSGLAEEN